MSRSSNRLFLLVLLSGIACVLISVFANQIGLSEGAVGKPRIILGVFGLVLIAIGTLRQKFLACYKGIAIVLTNTVVLLLCLEGAAALLNRYVLPQKAQSDDNAFIEVAHTGRGPATYVGFRGTPYNGKFVNVNERGLRVTPYEPLIDKQGNDEPIEVFAFGGSTMWGEGAADDETIAAFLQQKLEKQLERSVRVTNHGQRAWVSTQHVVQLMLELRDGRVPDVVVFYDGYNDVTSVYATGEVGVPENFIGLVHRVNEPLLLYRFRGTELGRMFAPLMPHRIAPQLEIEPTADRIVENYIGAIDVVQALSKQYGFAVRFYWQPQLLGDPKPLTDEERELLDHKWLPPIVKSLTTATYGRVAELAKNRNDLEDISDAFSGLSDRVYLDPCHVRRIGNERVAEVMLERGLLERVRNKAKALNDLQD
jgi:hypothetical protein